MQAMAAGTVDSSARSRGGRSATRPSARRLREVPVGALATLKIPADWASGVYLGKLTAEREGLQSYVIFIVRDDRKGDFLFQCSDTTWHAYNRWPGHSRSTTTARELVLGPGRRCELRPALRKVLPDPRCPALVGSGEFFLWEFPLAYWMEQQGYDVTYISNIDTTADPEGLLRAKGFFRSATMNTTASR